VNPSALKNFLMIVLKNAVNAVITNGGLMTSMSGVFNIHSTNGWWNLGKATVAVVFGREVTVWGPIILKWTTTSADPGATTPPAAGVK
jgi:hypothetical protein